VDSAIQDDAAKGKDDKWTRSIAVGSKPFIETIKNTLGFRVKGRKIVCAGDTFALREEQASFGDTNNADVGNTFLWNGIGNPFS
jgi:putative transposase